MLERAAALKHDLGKYVAWRSANLDESAWTGPVDDHLVAALQADLLRTRSGPAGDEAAWDVWSRLTADLQRPFDDAELTAVDEAVARLREHEDAVRSGDRDALASARSSIRDAQQRIRSALRDFHRRQLKGS